MGEDGKRERRRMRTGKKRSKRGRSENEEIKVWIERMDEKVQSKMVWKRKCLCGDRKRERRKIEK